MILRRISRYVRAPIDKFGYYGLLIRYKLLKYILDGTPFVLALQNRRTPCRTAIMSFFSFLGTEDCFTGIIPLLTWIFDARLGRLFTILLSVGFYTAGFFKCCLCLPRPPSPPVIPLHREEGDWAFPSNHATVGMLVPWYLFMYTCLHYDYWPVWARLLMFTISLFWCGGVTISRLYLGVHNLADMVAGAIAGMSILCIFLLTDNYIDYQCVAGRYVIPKALLVASILLYIHPRTNPETSSYGDSVILTGSTVGVVASRVMTLSSYGRHSLLQSLVSFDELPFATIIYRSVLRLIIGTSMIVGGRIILKPLLKDLSYRFYSWLELPAYSYKDYSQQYPATTKHFTAAYLLPPLPSSESILNFDDHKENNGNVSNTDNNVIHRGYHQTKCQITNASQNSLDGDNGSEEEKEEGIVGITNDTLDALPYDVDIPTRFITYSLLGWILGEGAPAVFDLIGI